MPSREYIDLLPAEYPIADNPDRYRVTIWLGRGDRTVVEFPATMPWDTITSYTEIACPSLEKGLHSRGATIYAIRGEVGVLHSKYHPQSGWKHVLPADRRP